DDGVERPPPFTPRGLSIRPARTTRPAFARHQKRAHRTAGAGPREEDGAPSRGSKGVGVSRSRMETRVERDEDAKHEPVEKKPPLKPDLKILESRCCAAPTTGRMTRRSACSWTSVRWSTGPRTPFRPSMTRVDRPTAGSSRP